MSHSCCHCGTSLRWWSLKGSFKCPSCGQALHANVTGAWGVTLVLWTVAEAVIVVAMPARDFAELVLRTILSLFAGVTLGWMVFGALSRVVAAPEATES